MRHDLVRKLRKAQGLTLVELSGKTGYTPSFLSQIERGLKEPSLDAMRRLADSLNIPVISLLEEQKEITSDGALRGADCSIIRRTERQRFTLDENGAKYELITPQSENSFQNFAMYGMLATIAPGNWSNAEPISHFYEECCYVISGKMHAAVGDGEYDLEAGDSLYIESFAFHNFQSTGDSELVIINFQAVSK